MLTLNLKDLSPALAHDYLQHAIAPRPIAFASTIDASGEVNLSPFSFFNIFSIHPPIVIFSPSRRLRNKTTKHTLQNVEEVPEVVINIVDYDMVQQISLASCEYPKGTNEFIKAGFTEEPATMVKPPMVKESKIKLECKVNQIIPLGDSGGSGNLVICEVLCMHIDDSILNDKTQIDLLKMHHVARLGANWYCKTGQANMFEIEKPNVFLGIGFDNLPEEIRNSTILTNNHLGQLANVHELQVIDPSFEDEQLKKIYQYFTTDPTEMEKEIHRHAAKLLDKGQVNEAWQVLLAAH